jgi:hypothetical protein
MGGPTYAHRFLQAQNKWWNKYPHLYQNLGYHLSSDQASHGILPPSIRYGCLLSRNWIQIINPLISLKKVSVHVKVF